MTNGGDENHYYSLKHEIYNNCNCFSGRISTIQYIKLINFNKKEIWARMK